MSAATQLLVIAYGNSLRRDDGAGLALAEQLVARWRQMGIALRHLAVHQLTPELALEISAPEVSHLLFVDTADDGAEEVVMHQLVTDTSGRVVGHHLTPESLLLYAEQLYHHAPPAWLLTIPGSDFGFGEGFSTQTTRLLSQAPTIAGEVLRKMEL